jgi:hypothetical protein
MPPPDFLTGAIDLHVHSAPDVDPRRYDDIDLAREAARAGMTAILIKSHQNSTAERATLVAKIVPEIRVFGGLVLNETVGGFNPAAVKLALAMGAKQIWMPTRSALNHRVHHGQNGDGLTVFDHSGHILPVVDDILDIIAGTDCLLGTGHLSPDESIKLISCAKKRGVRQILVTHPEWDATHFPVDVQRDLAVGGQVSFERCFVSTTHRCGFTPMKRIADAIAGVGVSTTVLSSDLGQPDTPPPAEGLAIFAQQLRSFGFSTDDIHRMLAENPRNLLGF